MEGKMDDSNKLALMSEPPPDYTESPKSADLSCGKLLILVMAVVVMALVVLTLLLAGLHITEKHTEAVLQMTIQRPDGKGSPQHLAMSQKEKLAIFPIHMKLNSSATVVYDYSNLVIGYRSWTGKACYVIRMNQKDIQSLDAVIKIFQDVQKPPPLLPLGQREKPVENLSAVPANRSMLGAAINLLCSSLSVYWA
ncbi:PREDICTED: pulmonary surfactant-associated protein C-like [Thamnophis sirtalis]|uniref:Surfactant protein C n=1 Tax=Thamnophis sirtalis TaxID=35019 RepID=A0A6I9XT74_9SAUR|nr:PREDICTED: pulmonary surfactant-associated protein C-like [Thamnophis sirtalis]